MNEDEEEEIDMDYFNELFNEIYENEIDDYLRG